MRIKVVLAATVATALLGTVTPASAADSSSPGTLGYTLGDTAFQVPGFHTEDQSRLQDIELTATVHIPRHVTRGTHPLVMMLHGMWETCADRVADEDEAAAAADMKRPDATQQEKDRDAAIIDSAAAKLQAWPCASGTPPLPSYRGYDYLGTVLADQGFVVVSVSANGINAGELGTQAYDARAALLNKHLAMWQQFVTNGTGELAGKLPEELRGHVDMNNVGLLGHSRGGQGVMWQAANAHRDRWPAGVTVKAIVPLAPAFNDGVGGEDFNRNVRVTDIPFMTVMGACDYAVGLAGRNYAEIAKGRNTAPITELTLSGANHNFFNTQWSPASGQVGANDDIGTPDSRGPHRSGPGRCYSSDKAHQDQRQLSEQEQRGLAEFYISVFFQRYLNGNTELEPVLTGEAPVAGVDVTYLAPQS